MRLYDRLSAAAHRAVAGRFGETIRVEPMVISEYTTAAADPDRGVVDAFATVSLSPSVDDFDGARQGTKINTVSRLAQRDARLWLTRQDYAAVGFELRAGDRIVLTERASEPAYLVARTPVRSDRGDVAVHLVQEDRP